MRKLKKIPVFTNYKPFMALITNFKCYLGYQFHVTGVQICITSIICTPVTIVNICVWIT